MKMKGVSLKGFTGFVKKHLNLQNFGAIGLGLMAPQVVGGLYQRVFNMLGTPGQRVADFMSTTNGQYLTGVLGTAGLLYAANRMGILDDKVALMAAGVSTSVVLLSYLSRTIGGTVGAYIPDVFSPVSGMAGGYIGGYSGGYLGYLGDAHAMAMDGGHDYMGATEERLFGVPSSVGNVNVF